MHVLAERTAVVPRVPPYQPGEFYLRELPPLHAVLDGLSGLGLLVVDGYTDLDPGGRPGLGAHAHAAFGIPVIGVAKSRFRTAIHAVPVVRGSAVRPLFVTAAGMPGAEAADLVRRMAGRYRLPDALRAPIPSRGLIRPRSVRPTDHPVNHADARNADPDVG
jgi:deoxyribonuclease V